MLWQYCKHYVKKYIFYINKRARARAHIDDFNESYVLDQHECRVQSRVYNRRFVVFLYATCDHVINSQSDWTRLYCGQPQEGLGSLHKGSTEEHRNVEETIFGMYLHSHVSSSCPLRYFFLRLDNSNHR